jgi:hypothetical protein
VAHLPHRRPHPPVRQRPQRQPHRRRGGLRARPPMQQTARLGGGGATSRWLVPLRCACAPPLLERSCLATRMLKVGRRTGERGCVGRLAARSPGAERGRVPARAGPPDCTRRHAHDLLFSPPPPPSPAPPLPLRPLLQRCGRVSAATATVALRPLLSRCSAATATAALRPLL